MTSMRGLLTTITESLRTDLMEGVQDADVPLSGSLNPKALGEMLPDVRDMRRFISGVMKVKRGDEESLSIAERGQLAMAFVSLLKGDRKQDAKVMRRLMTVQAQESLQEDVSEAATDAEIEAVRDAANDAMLDDFPTSRHEGAQRFQKLMTPTMALKIINRVQ